MRIPAKYALLLLLPSLASAQTAASAVNPDQWPTYGGDPGGSRYSMAAQINRSTVRNLKLAWIFHTGMVQDGSLETTPVLFKGSLYLSSQMDSVFSLDPATGQQRWVFHADIDQKRNLGVVTSRGVATWSEAPGSPSLRAPTCADRIFLGTLDGRLIALDAATGNRCGDFGTDGSVDLNQNVDYRPGDDYSVTSPPTVVGDVVVVGSGIMDNLRVDVELGDVRGFDAHSGKLLWTWQPIPWAKGQKLRTGAANTWGVIAADIEHGLIYLPTSSPSPDYYGGLRIGNNQDADSIVALDARTGKKVWAFQVVHHNLWDYDIAAEPLLFTFRGTVPAVAVATKMGLVFVFNRLTGEPLYPIHERPVPQSDVPGEVTSPTQPFPDLPPLSPIVLNMAMPLGVTAADDATCRRYAATLRYDGIYTPPSIKGTLLFPSNVGGVNWGSTALDPATGILYANTNRLPYVVHLEKQPLIRDALNKLRFAKNKFVQSALVLAVVLLIVLMVVKWRIQWWWFLAAGVVVLAVYLWGGQKIYKLARHSRLAQGFVSGEHFGKEYGLDEGAPYRLLREPMLSGSVPCGPVPFGTVSALNLNTGKIAWETPLGTVVPGKHTGRMNVGGPIVTAGGLVFTAATSEPLLRAFDSRTGEELWAGQLPVGAVATPMTYSIRGKQYVVIASGGRNDFATGRSDSIVAFALP